MRSSRTITLFASPPPASRSGSSAIAVSMLVHVAACAWLIYGLSNAPRITNKPAHEHFTVRILNVPSPEPQAQQVAHATPHTITAPASEAPRPTTPSPAAAAPPAPAAGGSPASMPSVATQLALLKPRTQILIQPDAPPDILIQRPVMLPNILRWSAPAIPTKTIVPSPPQKSIVATLRPKIELPNREVTPADIKMSSTPFATTLATLAPSTTTPVVVHGPDPAKRIPETASKQAQPPTPAQIMSLSNLQVKEGPVQIPLANSPASPALHESTGTGPAVNSAGAGQGNPLSNQAGSGPGQSPSASAGKSTAGSGTGTQAAKGSGAPGPAQAAKGNGAPGPAQAAKNDGPSGSSPGPAADANPGPELGSVIGGPVTHIHLAKDGQFGFVVVGSQIAEQYPETVGLWGGRLVYTVYVHMGSGKPWILQYALPPAAQAAANNSRPDAPWPFDIVQPHLDPADYTSDALMVHGFVNVAGRFDHLAVVFPSDFAKAKFLLSALQQWQFRPGRQNGQLAAIEILLIIPDQEE